LANKPGWDTRDYGTAGKTFGYNGAGANHAAIPKLNIFQNNCAGSNPAMVSNLYLTDFHRKGMGRGTATELVIRICYVNIRPKHVAIADFHIAACVDHQIAIKVIIVPYGDSDSVKRHIDRPKPAPLRKGIEFADPNLGEPPAPTLSFHPVPASHLHAEHAVEKEPHAAGGSARHTK
jgi:hypothetical protein